MRRLLDMKELLLLFSSVLWLAAGRHAEAQARREVEHDRQVRAGLAARRDERLSQLDERLRLLAVLEADLQCLGFERRRHGQHNVGEFGGRGHEQVSLDEKVQLRSASRPRALSAWAITMLPPKLTSALIRRSRAAV